MLNLSVQDKFDGLNKVNDLRDAIGKDFSDNYSGTGRSILISVSDDGNTCVVKECRSQYNDRQPKSGKNTQPSWLTWNAMFF